MFPLCCQASRGPEFRGVEDAQAGFSGTRPVRRTMTSTKWGASTALSPPLSPAPGAIQSSLRSGPGRRQIADAAPRAAGIPGPHGGVSWRRFVGRAPPCELARCRCTARRWPRVTQPRVLRRLWGAQPFTEGVSVTPKSGRSRVMSVRRSFAESLFDLLTQRRRETLHRGCGLCRLSGCSARKWGRTPRRTQCNAFMGPPSPSRAETWSAAPEASFCETHIRDARARGGPVDPLGRRSTRAQQPGTHAGHLRPRDAGR